MLLMSPVKIGLDQILEQICLRLQITQAQHDRAEGRYTAVAKHLASPLSPISQFNPRIYTQGSLRIGTTLRPFGRNEFDLDLVCELQIHYRSLRVRVSELMKQIGEWMGRDPRYAKIVEIRNRCVRLNYKDDFHLDIVIACLDTDANDGRIRIPDRQENEWKVTNPQGYAGWFEGRVQLAESQFRGLARIDPVPEYTKEKLPLKRIVQLAKRRRDIGFAGSKPQIEPVSIVLTTLAGGHYQGQASANVAMLSMLNAVTASIPAIGRLKVLNPVIAEEDLSERWDDREAYLAFVAWINEFKTDWIDLQDQQGLHHTAKLLKKMFGESPVDQILNDAAEEFNTARDSKKIFVEPRTGGSLKATAAASSIAVPRNTFHGE